MIRITSYNVCYTKLLRAADHPLAVRVGLAQAPADLERRDLTIHAIALDLADGEVSDPYDGIGDLGRRLVITSYSIHYTKLYDETPIIATKAHPMRNEREQTETERLNG